MKWEEIINGAYLEGSNIVRDHKDGADDVYIKSVPNKKGTNIITKFVDGKSKGIFRPTDEEKESDDWYVEAVPVEEIVPVEDGKSPQE